MPTATAMRELAEELVDLLSSEQRSMLVDSWDSPERGRWQYTPGPRAGLALAGMDSRQREVAMSLLRSGLGEQGFTAARAVMALESVLHDLEQRRGEAGCERRHPDHYWFAVFGNPARSTEPWAWRVGGHHVCVHATVAGGGMSMLPLFLGANPAVAPDGSRILAAEEDLGRGLG